MRNGWLGAFALAGLALAAAPAGAGSAVGLGIGDRAPLPQAKELIGISSYQPKEMDGKVVFLEIFRTW